MYPEDFNYKNCEHSDVDLDERCCLDCGKDLSEDLMAKAYDYWKDKKYED